MVAMPWWAATDNVPYYYQLLLTQIILSQQAGNTQTCLLSIELLPRRVPDGP